MVSSWIEAWNRCKGWASRRAFPIQRFGWLGPCTALLAFLLFFPPLTIPAQDPFFRRIDIADGLPHNAVYGLFQDSKGLVWITTDEGLCRYDGHSFKPFASATQSSRAGANIFEDPFGRIWYENFDGRLYYVSADSLIALEMGPRTGYSRAGCRGRYLYVPDDFNLQVYDLGTLEKVWTVDGKPGDVQGTGWQGERYYWWIGGKNHLGIDAQSRIVKIPVNGNGLGLGRGTAFDLDGKVFSLMQNGEGIGVSIFQDGKFSPFAGLAPEKIVQAHAALAGKIWLCYARGMEVIEVGKGFEAVRHRYFGDKSISAVMLDREGNYWFGTTDEGILMVPDFDSQSFPIGNKGITRIQGTDDASLWMGTKEGEILRFDTRSRDYYSVYQNENRHSIDFLFEDGRVLIEGSPAGHFIRKTDFKVDRSSNSSFKDAIRLTDRYLAVNSSSGSGLFVWENGAAAGSDPWDSLFHAFQNPHDSAFSYILKGRGRSVCGKVGSQCVYFATSNGLMRVVPTGFSEIKYQGNRFYGAQMQSVGNRTFILNTVGELFILGRNDRLEPMVELPIPPPYSRIRFLGGRLYVLARKHLLVLNIGEGNPVIENVVGGIDAAYVHDMALAGDRLALGTDNGLILLNPQKKASTMPPQIVITQVRAGGHSFATDSIVQVAYEDKEIEIFYSILNFSTGGDYPAFYRINQGNWIRTLPGSRQLQIAQPASGEYVLEFCLGLPSENIAARVRFNILSPFWMKTWFLILCFCMVLGLIIFVFWQRTRILQRHNARTLEKMDLENKLRLSTLRAIRSQMNPHFFFNALNTIQSYIFSDNKRSASNYLGKFSRLTRMVLEMSDKEYVSLDEEIESLTLYLDLEQSRFGDQFEYKIEIGPGISTISTLLPSMIIQPFAENAMKHGLLHKTGPKKLHLAFQAVENQLQISVDDNGIGRQRSAEINQVQAGQHRSFSTEANQKRIDILNAGHNRIGVKFTDKHDENGQASGTLVQISLPLILQ